MTNERLLVFIFFLFFFVIIITGVSIGQNQIYPPLPSDEIVDMHFINDEEIIYINAGGSIYKSNDAGANWELKKHYGLKLREIHFLDEENGYVIPSRNAEVIYTKDRGETWVTHKLSIFYTQEVLPVSSNRIIKSNEGSIELNDNFHNYWETVYQLPEFTDSLDYLMPVKQYGRFIQFEKKPDGTLLALAHLDNAYYSGVITDSLNILLTSSNEGTTWDTLWTGKDKFVSSVHFPGNQHGWMNTGDALYKTQDGGQSWNHSYSTGGIRFSGISTPDSTNLVAIARTSGQRFIRTTDAGDQWESWSLVDYLPNIDHYKISFRNKNTGFIYGNDFLKTHDAGNSWELVTDVIKDNIYSLGFWNVNEGVALGGKGLYKTENGGESWTHQFKPENLISNAPGNVIMFNETEGWLATNRNIYKTTTGIDDFEPDPISSNDERYRGLAFYDKNLGIVHSVSERVEPGRNYFEFSHHYVTIDGGDNWTKVAKSDHESTLSFDNVAFTSPDHLWGRNRNGIWLSNDTARTWQQVFTHPRANFISCFSFLNSSIGVVSHYNYLFLTVDGGTSWKEIPKNYSRARSCATVDKNKSGRYRYIEVGENGDYYQMNFYGNGTVSSLGKRTTYSNQRLNTLFTYIEDGVPHIWAAGNGFTLHKQKLETIKPTDIDQQDVPAAYRLLQNYPNPFNPITVIRYELPEQTPVRVEVYDVMGRLISTLVDSPQAAGMHEVNWDGSHVASGLYLYRLKAGDFVQTRQMMLIK